MIDFNEIAAEQIIARGQYSIVRAARETALKSLRDMCESQNNAATSVLRDIQGATDTERHFAFMHDNLARMAETVGEIEELTQQLALIRPMAFPQ
jgi:hypothetical protein